MSAAVEHHTHGGATDCPKLDYSGQWFKNAEALENQSSQVWIVNFPAGECYVQRARVQQSKDETQAWLSVDLRGGDFGGSFKARYDPATATWKGDFVYSHIACIRKTEGTVEVDLVNADGTGTLTTRVPVYENGPDGPCFGPPKYHEQSCSIVRK